MTRHWYLTEIAAALEAPDSADPELLGDSAVAYADACHTVNQRLNVTDALLSRGLRSEAIGLADVTPSLLDEVGALDFPKRGDWVQLLVDLGMQPPPPLDADERAATLNAAYAQEAGLKPLLDKHRLLALGRAPLSARLQIVRQLRRSDPENPCWPEEVERYEAARFNELTRALNESTRAGDAAGVAAVASELASNEWSLTPPSALVARAMQSAADLGAVRAKWELEELLPSLESAHGELDSIAIAPLAADWRRLAAEARLSPSDSLAERAAPALEWHDDQQLLEAEERAFNRSLAQLETALNNGADATTLEKAYAAAERFERPLPELLEQRTVNRLDSLEQWRRRRLFVAIGSAAAVLVVCLVSGGLWAWRAAHRAEVALHAEALGDLLQNNSLQAAEEYVGKLSSTMSLEPEVAKLATETKSRVEAERLRADGFDELATRAEAMDPKNPDRSLLATLMSLAVTDEEKRRALKIKSAVADADDAIRRDREAQLTEALLRWAKRLGDLDRSLRQGKRLDEATRKSLVDDITTELTGFPGVSSTYRTQANALVAKARTLIAYERQLDSRWNELDSLVDAVGNEEKYAAALNRFTGNHPNAPEALAMKRIIGDNAWRSVVRWNAYWQPIGASFADLSPEQAAALLEKGRELLPPDATPTNPLAAEFRRREDHLARIAKRPESLAKLRGWLREPLFNTWAIAKKNGDVLYSAKKPMQSGESLSFERYVDVMKGRASSATREAVWSGPAPHAVFCQAVLKDLDDNPGTRWESRFARHSIDLLRLVERPADDDLPPINRLVALDLFRRLLLIGGEGSGPFAAATTPTFEAINSAPLDFMAPWYLDDDDRGTAAVAAAIPLIPSSTQFTSTLQTAAAEFDRLRGAAPTAQWVGLIDVSRNGNPPILLRDQAKMTGKLAVLADDGSDFVVVGTVDSGTISANGIPKAATGSPVFLLSNTH